MKRILIAGLSGALALSLAGISGGNAVARPATGSVATQAAGSAAKPRPSSTVRWRTCPKGGYDYASYGIECATVKVPLDYRHRKRGTVKIEISRKRHDPKLGPSKGILLVNPGGPGGSGLIMPAYQDFVPGNAAKRYDWIGFDPRGVGASSPSLHCDRGYVGTDRPTYVPRTAKLMRYWRKKTRGYARDCAHAKGKRLLRHMTSADNARDLDAIRKALGERKISFYGFSWGTYLGASYATLFPKRVTRMILDGVVDPTRVWYKANLDQDRAFDKNMNVYWRYLAKRDASFGLGTKWKKIRKGYYRQLRVLDKKPAAGGKLGPDELGDAMLSAGYYVYDWVDIGRAYAALVNDGDGTALLAMYRDSNMGAENENGYAVYNAVQCTDASWPGWAKTKRDTWRVHRKAPFLTWGNTWYNAPCLTWAAPSQRPLKITGAKLKHKVLMISETEDAATPYSGAIALRKRFPTASLIAGTGGTTHAGSLSGIGCVDNRIASYLAKGTVPKRKQGQRADRFCPPVPAPEPTAPAARKQAQDLRHALLAAQRMTLH